jgi:(p)ppGpp synthase/HD superfamily hydrolase
VGETAIGKEGVSAPRFTRRSPLVEESFRFAVEAYRDRGERGAVKLRHSVEVAGLLHEAGFSDEVVAAGLLHDVVEFTPISLDEIRERFGSPVVDLVGVMTEDERISSYEERKAEHRGRVAAAGPLPAAIYAADKLAKMPHLHDDPGAISQRRFDHYAQTAKTLRARHPDLPFLDELDRELATLLKERARTAVRGQATDSREVS